jgi:hypothetical protein
MPLLQKYVFGVERQKVDPILRGDIRSIQHIKTSLGQPSNKARKKVDPIHKCNITYTLWIDVHRLID